jgi:hypothetical protein
VAGAECGAADTERGAIGAVEAAGAKIDFIEGMLGTFPVGLTVCFKFEGRGRGKGGASGRIECVPEAVADGGGDVLKSPSFGLSGAPPISTRVAGSGPTSRSGCSIVAVAGGDSPGDVLWGTVPTTLSVR